MGHPIFARPAGTLYDQGGSGVRRMDHYELEDWADFVRGTLRDETQSAMKRHLDTSCETCLRSVRFLTNLADVAARDHSYDVASAPLAEAATRAFTTPAPAPTLAGRLAEGLRSVVAVLVYDSAAELRPAGVRTTDPPARHLMFEAGSYVVDVRLEEPGGEPLAYLIGQVVNRSAPEALFSGISVSLLAGAKLVATAKSDPFGEFILQYQVEPDLRLRIPLPAAGEQIEIRLASLREGNDENTP